MRKRQADDARAPALPLAETLWLCGGVFALFVSLGAVLQPRGLFGILAYQVLLLAVPTLLVARAQGNVLGLLGLTMPSLRALVGATLVGASTWYVLDAGVIPLQEWLLPTPEALTQELERMIDPSAPLWLLLLTFALAPAVCEELLFRGALQRALSRHMGALPAVIVSALFFAAFHLSIYRALPTFLLGLSFGTALLGCRSVVPSMVMHALHNGAVLLVDPRRHHGEASWWLGHHASAGVIAVTILALGWFLMFLPQRRSS